MTDSDNHVIGRRRLAALLRAERATYATRHPASRAAHAAATNLLGGVPMTWMAKQAGGFPLYLARAAGARVIDLDGHELLDFCLGDTAAMAGHSPPPTVAAVTRRFTDAGGATAMMPTEDASAVAAELTRRFGLGTWSFSLTATDANRWALRLSRAVTGRPRILVNSYCYHGSVDESLIVTGDGDGQPRPGSVGAPCEVAVTSRVVEYNDLPGLERQLAHADVAAVLMEPALTNMGIVLPDPGYLDGVRQLTRDAGVLLINDETHTISAGPGGCTQAWELEPDIVTVGKAIGGGIPAAAYGLTDEVVERLADRGGPRPGRHRRGRRDDGRQRHVAGRRTRHARGGAHRCRLRPHDRTGHAVHRRRPARHRQLPAAVVRHPTRSPRRVSIRPACSTQRHAVAARPRTQPSRTSSTCSSSIAGCC